MVTFIFLVAYYFLFAVYSNLVRICNVHLLQYLYSFFFYSPR